ncbi:hypothetical protein MK489_07965 [Myxococcota bacterium]|nr:hypothetical protein [Myxococcota bacterium]
MIGSRWRKPVVSLSLALLWVVSDRAAAYEVEPDSTGNAIYILLWNAHPCADFESIHISDGLPAFVSVATASILPASVPAATSDLAAVEFDVGSSASLGAMGSITLTVSGSSAGQPVDVILEVPADPNLAPEGEALLDIARRGTIRSLLESHGAVSNESPPLN